MEDCHIGDKEDPKKYRNRGCRQTTTLRTEMEHPSKKPPLPGLQPWLGWRGRSSSLDGTEADRGVTPVAFSGNSPGVREEAIFKAVLHPKFRLHTGVPRSHPRWSAPLAAFPCETTDGNVPGKALYGGPPAALLLWSHLRGQCRSATCCSPQCCRKKTHEP